MVVGLVEVVGENVAIIEAVAVVVVVVLVVVGAANLAVEVAVVLGEIIMSLKFF